MIPTCDRCSMKFSSSIFWDWHKVGSDRMVMCRNGAGKPYTEPKNYNIITNVDNTYINLGQIDRN